MNYFSPIWIKYQEEKWEMYQNVVKTVQNLGLGWKYWMQRWWCITGVKNINDQLIIKLEEKLKKIKLRVIEQFPAQSLKEQEKDISDIFQIAGSFSCLIGIEESRIV